MWEHGGDQIFGKSHSYIQFSSADPSSHLPVYAEASQPWILKKLRRSLQTSKIQKGENLNSCVIFFLLPLMLSLYLHQKQPPSNHNENDALSILSYSSKKVQLSSISDSNKIGPDKAQCERHCSPANYSLYSLSTTKTKKPHIIQ